MVKSIFKETFIMLLLCVAIMLVLGVLFYNYIPTSKVIPNKVEAYTIPENIQNELKDTNSGNQAPAIVTYEITESDLNLYKKTQEYNPGKIDPFSKTANENTVNGSANTNTSGGTSGNTTNPDSTGSFFNDAGSK